MSDLVASGRLVDLILGLMVLEGVLLAAFRHRTGRGIALGDLVVNLLAGGALLLALRAALTGAGWPSIALWLALALLAHMADLARRWRP